MRKIEGNPGIRASWALLAALVAGGAGSASAAGDAAPAGGTPATGQTAATEGGEEAAEKELVALLAEQTDLATKTRMNSDYVPGLVTVLHGDELEALGVHTVWEALALVPGVQVVRDDRGSPSLTIRGIDFVFNTGNTKVLVNDVSMSRESAGVNNSILLLPIEQVDRIEMIRGPGSAIHGDFAFSGLINIITRKDGGHVMARGQDPSSWTGAVENEWKSHDNSTRLSVSFSALTSQDADAPIPFSATEERRAGFVDAEGKFGWFRAQVVTRDFQPEAAPHAPTSLNEDNWALAWGGRFGLGAGWSLDASATRSRTEHDTLPDRLFDGSLTDLELALIREGKKHDTLIGASWWSGTLDHGVLAPPPPIPPLEFRDGLRIVRSLTFQEQVRPVRNLTLTVGARWDELSDVGSELSPRLAVVWQVTDRNVLKAQYAEAFRAPTFFEVSPTGATPHAERMATTELAWIYRRPTMTVRATAFHAVLTDGLGPGPHGPANVRSATTNGAELEWSTSLAQKVKLITNVSYVEATRDSIAFGWARWLANAALIATPGKHVTVGWRVYHVGTRYATGGQEFDGFDWMDATVTFKDVGRKGLDFRLGVKNALQDGLSAVINTPMGADTPTFGGRTWWASVAYAW